MHAARPLSPGGAVGRRRPRCALRRAASVSLFGGGKQSKDLQLRVQTLEAEAAAREEARATLVTEHAELTAKVAKLDAESKRRLKRLEEAEREVFKLEKLVEEKDAKFASFEATAKKQIKLLEGMLKEAREAS